MNKGKILGKLAKVAMLAAFITLAHFYVTAIAQPGEANDPLVTRNYVNTRINQLNQQINYLRNIIYNIDPNLLTTGSGAGTGTGAAAGTGAFTAADRDALFADVMLYFELMYGGLRDNVEMLINATAPTPVSPQVVPFEPLFVQAGRSIIMEAGVEVILRSGQATAISGPNGLVDMTAGRDVVNGQAISQNHLMIVPATDGRGMRFTTDAWIMIKGSYQVVNW